MLSITVWQTNAKPLLNYWKHQTEIKETVSRLVVARDRAEGGRENWAKVIKGYKLAVTDE